jgi:hypothetical protein
MRYFLAHIPPGDLGNARRFEWPELAVGITSVIDPVDELRQLRTAGSVTEQDRKEHRPRCHGLCCSPDGAHDLVPENFQIIDNEESRSIGAPRVLELVESDSRSRAARPRISDIGVLGTDAGSE